MRSESIIDSSYKYYKQFTKDLKPLSAEEERSICSRIAAGDQVAQEILVLHNIHLAEKLALDKVARIGDYQLSDDAIQTAICALSEAAASFNPNQGTKFSTYATHAIENALQNALNIDFKPTQMERHFYYDVYVKVMNFNSEYAAQNDGQLPTQDQAVEQLGITPTQYQTAMSVYFMNRPISLDAHIDETRHSDDDEITVADTLADVSESDFVENMAVKDTVRDALSCLSERSREIVSLRFGINGHTEHNLEDIASLFGVSVPRISRLLNESLDKMQEHLTRGERASRMNRDER